MSAPTQPRAEPIVKPETFAKFSEDVREGLNLFECDYCSHFAGDSRTHNFRAKCPRCEREVRFYRIIA